MSPSARLTALTLLVAAIAATAALYGRGGGTSRVDGPAAGEAPGERATGATLEALDGGADERSAATAAAAPRDVPVEDAPVAAASHPSRVVLRFRVEDADGAWHRVESGDAHVTVYAASGRSRTAVLDVVEGRAEVELAGASEALVHHAELGGRRAFPRQSVRVLPGDGERTVDLRWPRQTLLEVRSSATNARLDGVEVRMTTHFPERNFADARGGGRIIATDAPSPVELPLARFTSLHATFHARAPGHAWGKVQVDLVRAGERVLVLQPGGALEVTVSGDGVPDGAVVRVARERSQGTAIAERDLGDSRIVRFDALPAGALHVTLEVGATHDDPIVLGESVATVLPGGLALVTLTASAPDMPAAVPLAGEVLVPAAWGAEGVAMSRELLGPALLGQDPPNMFDDGALEPVGEGRYRFSFDGVQAGRHVLRLTEPPFTWLVETGPSGATGLLLELPPPVDVVVRAVESATGDAIPVGHVSWVPVPPMGSGGYRTRRAKRGPVGTDIRVRVPRTTVRFSAEWDDRVPASEDVEVTRDGQVVELALARAQGMLVTFTDGDAPLQLDLGEFWIRTLEDEWPDGMTVTGSPDGVTRVVLRAPGRYRIMVERQDGFRRFEPVEVDVGAAEFADVEIVLERDR